MSAVIVYLSSPPADNILYTLARRSGRTSAEIELDCEEYGAIPPDRLHVLIDRPELPALPPARNELIRLCLFGFCADLETTEVALEWFGLETLKRKSKISYASPSGRIRLCRLYQAAGSPTFRKLAVECCINIGQISRLLKHDTYKVTRNVLIRLCSFGLGCRLSAINGVLKDYRFEPLSP